MKFRTGVMLPGLMALLTAAWTAPAVAEKITVKIGSGHSPSWHFIALTQNQFIPEVKKRVKEKTGHEIEFIELVHEQLAPAVDRQRRFGRRRGFYAGSREEQQRRREGDRQLRRFAGHTCRRHRRRSAGLRGAGVCGTRSTRHAVAIDRTDLHLIHRVRRQPRDRDRRRRRTRRTRHPRRPTIRRVLIRRHRPRPRRRPRPRPRPTRQNL